MVREKFFWNGRMVGKTKIQQSSLALVSFAAVFRDVTQRSPKEVNGGALRDKIYFNNTNQQAIAFIDKHSYRIENSFAQLS